MEIIGIKTPLINRGDEISKVLIGALKQQKIKLSDQDILVASSKVLAISENRVVELDSITPSSRAIDLGKRYKVPPELAELVIQESDIVLGGIPSLILTIRNNVLLANAGIDKSNTPDGWVSLLPSNSFVWANRLKSILQNELNVNMGVIVADSRSQPLRQGLIGVALGVAGIEPIVDERGHKDLYGRPLKITRRAIADDLVSAAQLIMGESNESMPFVLIRGASVSFTNRQISSSDFTIPLDTCLYFTILKQWTQRKQGKTD